MRLDTKPDPHLIQCVVDYCADPDNPPDTTAAILIGQFGYCGAIRVAKYYHLFTVPGPAMDRWIKAIRIIRSHADLSGIDTAAIQIPTYTYC